MIEIPFTLPVLALGAIIAQGVFASVLLLTHPTNRQANRWLGLLLFAFALWIIDAFYRAGQVYQQDPDFYFQPIYYSLAFGPFLFFYVKKLTMPQFLLRPIHGLHFLPVVLQAGLYWFLFFQDYPFRRWFWFIVHQPYTYNLEFNLSLLSLLLYALLSVRQLRAYRSWLDNHYSENSDVDLNWLRFLLLLIALLCTLWMVDVFLREVLAIYREQSISTIAMSITLLLLAFGSLRQNSTAALGYPGQEKKAVSAPAIAPQLTEQIRQCMERERAYLHPTLSLKEFAALTGQPARTVSTHINHGLGLSFIDFVNGYRVAAFQRAVEQGGLRQKTMLALALESGFNAKSTFNRVFKKVTGQSPREYVEKTQNVN